MQASKVNLWIEAGFKKLEYCFDEAVDTFSFNQNEDEPCVYKKASGSTVVFFVLYVDDIGMLNSVKLWLSKTFSMKDLGNASYILGIKIYRDRLRKLIGLSQSMYVDKVLGRFIWNNLRSVSYMLDMVSTCRRV